MHAGTDLQRLVEEARVIRGTLAGLHSRYNRKVIEQAAIAGVLTQRITSDPRSDISCLRRPTAFVIDEERNEFEQTSSARFDV